MKLFDEDLQVLNVGLASFAAAIVDAGGKASQIEWAPLPMAMPRLVVRSRDSSTIKMSRPRTARHTPPTSLRSRFSKG